MPILIDDGSAFRELFEIDVDDGGAQRSIVEIFVDDGSAWQRVFPGDVFALPGYATVVAFVPDEAIVDYIVYSDGTCYASGGGGGNWVTPTSSASRYEIRATLTNSFLSGDATIEGTFDAWLPMSSTQSWRYRGHDSGQFDMTLEIRVAGGGSVVYSQSVSLVGTVESPGG